MSNSEAVYERDRDKFEARRKRAELDDTNLSAAAPVFHVPRADKSEFDYPSVEDVKRIYKNVAHEIVQLLYKHHYTILAFQLKQKCLEAILDGLDETSVRHIAEEGLKEADTWLYQFALRKPDLSDTANTL